MHLPGMTHRLVVIIQLILLVIFELQIRLLLLIFLVLCSTCPLALPTSPCRTPWRSHLIPPRPLLQGGKAVKKVPCTPGFSTQASRTTG